MLASLNYVLIGNTGAGKSRTGNSILDKNAFQWEGTTSSVTQNVFCEESHTVQERCIRVVDTPGVCDPETKESISSQLRKTMRNTMQHSNNGYHAVLLVFKYGVMSREDKDVFESIMKCYGRKFLELHCILIITCGDNFETERAENGETFEQWCTNQNKFFGDLLQQCGNRILLFDNMTKDERKRRAQRRKLIQMTEHLQLTNGERLTKERFATNFDYRCSVM